MVAVALATGVWVVLLWCHRFLRSWYQHMGRSSSNLLFCEHGLDDALDMWSPLSVHSVDNVSPQVQERSMDKCAANWLANVRVTYPVILAPWEKNKQEVHVRETMGVLGFCKDSPSFAILWLVIFFFWSHTSIDRTYTTLNFDFWLFVWATDIHLWYSLVGEQQQRTAALGQLKQHHPL